MPIPEITNRSQRGHSTSFPAISSPSIGPQQWEITRTSAQQQNNSPLANGRQQTIFGAVRTTNFVMIPKLYSESVQLQNLGPRPVKKYRSTARLYKSEKSYCTRVEFVRSTVPVNYVTVLVHDGGITHYERVDFERRTVMRNFSESVNYFPRERVDMCRSDFYEADGTKRYYIERLELAPVQKMSVTAVKLAAAMTDGVVIHRD